VAVVDGVTGEKLYLFAVVMRLDSLPVVLRFYEIRTCLCLEECDVFLACQHWSDRTENCDFIIQRYLRVLELFAHLQQIVCQVKKVMCVFVKTVQH
jgi:hypothetical protein